MTEALEVLIALHTSRSLLPRKAYPTDAGFDLAVPGDCTIAPQSQAVIDLEFAIQIPPGWYGHVFGRSSAFRDGLLVNPGIIDADYRGTVRLLVYNRLAAACALRRGDRVAQMLILPVPQVTLITVQPEALSRTARGPGGIGSTGR
jgi:dUTP pyrophosphatase